MWQGGCSSELDGKLNSVLMLLRRSNSKINGIHETVKAINNNIGGLTKNFR